jgi:hypothetical protein
VVEWWSGGVVEWWSGGVVEYWSIGVLEYWSIGVLEYWSIGGLEGWRVGGLGFNAKPSSVPLYGHRAMLPFWLGVETICAGSRNR